MALGLGTLGLAPDVFWHLTPTEFNAIQRGRLGLLRGEGPPSRGDLDRLMQRYPDRSDGP